jgi:multidrug resistance efflux pump
MRVPLKLIQCQNCMSIAFSRSMRSFAASNFRGASIGIFTLAVVLAVWTFWGFWARVSLYEVTDTARLEVEYAAHPIEAHVSGRIVNNYLRLGERVEAGQVLVELDANTERLELAEEQTQPLALESQVAALRSEVRTEEAALNDARQTARAALDESRAKLREAEEAARFAHLEVERLTPLRTGGFISDLEFLRSKSEAQKRDAAAESARLAVVRLDQEHRTIGRDRQARLDRLKGEITRAENQMFTDTATIRKLENEIVKRRIEAPVSGRIGEVAEQLPGSFVTAGSKLGAIIPDGGLKVVAYFPAQSALGRIQPGQVGRLRLDGFPWSQYGSLAATVTSVGGEAKDGRVRVELQVSANQSSLIPVQHGLPGTVEIELKKVSPFMLVLQALEKTFITPKPLAK